MLAIVGGFTIRRLPVCVSGKGMACAVHSPTDATVSDSQGFSGIKDTGWLTDTPTGPAYYGMTSPSPGCSRILDVDTNAPARGTIAGSPEGDPRPHRRHARRLADGRRERRQSW